MDYSPGIKFQTSLINMDGEKSPTTINQVERNQQKWCRCGSIKSLQVTSKDCPVGLAIRKSKRLALGMRLSQFEAKKAEEDSTEEEKITCLEAEATGEGEK